MTRLFEDVDVDADNDEEEYDENADQDFDPSHAPEDGDHSSTSEDEEDAQYTAKSRETRKRKFEPAMDGLDSGDEATIKERRKKKKKRKVEVEEDDESAGEGYIRTRAQRQADKLEQKQRRQAASGPVTIDVDKVWADLISIPVGRPSSPTRETEFAATEADQGQDKENAPVLGPTREHLITIKRRIQYAGEVTEVEEQVPRSSKEAQKYLAQHPEADPDHYLHHVDAKGLRRPLKRHSIFEPNPTSVVKGVPPEKLRPRAPSSLDVKRMEDERKKKALNMSTVQKSALDWKGFVDKEGIRDELAEYGKSKKGFMGREAFLDRAAGAREQAARDARLKS